MGFAETVLLGAIAGFTIYLGLPVGRVERVDDRLRVGLAMFAVGILAFIFMDVTKHGQEIVDTTLQSFKDHQTGFAARARPVRCCWPLGSPPARLASPASSVRLRRRRPSSPPIAGGAPGAAFTAAELTAFEFDARRAALRTGMTIAAAIGLHNFAEGLAIGVSAKAGAIGLATVLIIGFGLHNATEGFGIVGPARRCAAILAAGSDSPAWSAAARRSWARSSATRSTPTPSSCAFTRSRAARSCT